MGGNILSEVHPAVGSLKDLKALILSDNLLESLPAAIASLKNLKTLQLHKNRLRTLPTEIISLKCLSEVKYLLWEWNVILANLSKRRSYKYVAWHVFWGWQNPLFSDVEILYVA
jgi:Leucine-rich repeat (LRR) protein